MKIEPINMMTAEPLKKDLVGVESQAIAQERAIQVKSPPPKEKDPRQGSSNKTEDIQKGIEEINDQVKSMNWSLQFSVDEKTKDIVVKIVDKQSGEVIRQIPPEGILKLRGQLKEMAGLIVEETV